MIRGPAALQAAGATNLNYHWSVAGIAVTKQITPGMLTLLRSQGSGPMTVTLVLDNGGALVTNTATIAVKEPATDPWVVRQPEADEKPMHGQFYARDNTGFGTVYYNGTLSNAPNTVFLNLYADGVLYTNLSQTVSGSAYAFSARLASGLVKYSVQFGSVRGGVTNVFDTVTNLVCGDAYLIDGQSNAVADNNNPPYAAYTSDWIRSYGNMTGGTNSGWGNAVVSTAHGDAYRIGYWGMVLASNLVASCNIPICIINGAVGGTRVDQHQRNESNPEDGDTIYGRILTRVKGARLTHGIRGVLWHQGENNSGAAAPTGDWDYKSYQQYFVDMSAAWKQDYPNLLHYYVYQVWPLPCGMGPKGDQVREAQRTLPRFYSNMRIMSTVGMATRPEWARGLCHFDWDGYVMFADLMAPLVKRDNYGFIPTSVITAPDLKKAYFTSARQDEIALEFGQAMEAPGKTNATANFYLDLVPNLVTAISVRDNVVKLQLLGPATAQTIAYLADRDWDGNQAHLLRGANRIAALTFCEVPILRAAGAQPAGEKQR